MKSAWASKTVGVAVLQAVAGVLAALVSANPTLVTVGWVMVVKSVLDVALRFVTVEPVHG